MKFFWLVWPRSTLPGSKGQLQPKVNCSSFVLMFLLGALTRARFAQTKAALLIPPPVVDQSAGFSERV